MKIVSVLVFAAAMVGSWILVHGQKPVSESVHAGIQSDLKQIIADYIQKNRPESKNIVFQRFWTETINPNKVKALFLYSFEDKTESGEMAEVTLEGSAILNKTNETPEMATWSFDELKILGNAVTFTEPLQITAGEGDQAPTPTPDVKKESTHN